MTTGLDYSEMSICRQEMKAMQHINTRSKRPLDYRNSQASQQYFPQLKASLCEKPQPHQGCVEWACTVCDPLRCGRREMFSISKQPYPFFEFEIGFTSEIHLQLHAFNHTLRTDTPSTTLSGAVQLPFTLPPSRHLTNIRHISTGGYCTVVLVR